ncbi:hypothetical protein [Exiguobacterium aurantiacum]|uniref:DUF4825 domain-containing protein n=1 Tax=Exiguobacterium aurantiacum TaxID=33987 RepID=A0ABY5FK84_9BACL|nr:hypothetical protein [Exiguobacterium aurantiacum]UTT41967.1 hypothetical protein NMQ00_10380 [Exiguobacterium aurantiacum]
MSFLLVIAGILSVLIFNLKVTESNDEIRNLPASSNEFNPSFFPSGASTTEVSNDTLVKIFGAVIDKSEMGTGFTEYLFKINEDNNFEYKASFMFEDNPVELIGYNFDINIETDTSDQRETFKENLTIYYLEGNKVMEVKNVSPKFTFHLVDRNNKLTDDELKGLMTDLIKM